MKSELLTGAFFIAALTLLGMPSVAVAGDDQTVAVWLAADVSAGAGDEAVGQLRLRDDRLSFRAMDRARSWELPLADARLVELSKGGQKSLRIETASGDQFTLTILDNRMLVDSPRKAVRKIVQARQAVSNGSGRPAAVTARAVPSNPEVKTEVIDGRVR